MYFYQRKCIRYDTIILSCDSAIFYSPSICPIVSLSIWFCLLPFVKCIYSMWMLHLNPSHIPSVWYDFPESPAPPCPAPECIYIWVFLTCFLRCLLNVALNVNVHAGCGHFFFSLWKQCFHPHLHMPPPPQQRPSSALTTPNTPLPRPNHVNLQFVLASSAFLG